LDDKIITGECRASFPKLAKPDESKFGQGKFSLDGIFESEEQSQSMMDACKAHAKSYYGTEEGIKYPWRDGNELSKYTGYEGNQFIRCKSKQKPTIVDHNRKPIDPNEVYGGAVVRVNCTPLAYELEEEVVVIENGKRTKKKEQIKGVTLLLNAVQLVRDGESFGGAGGDGFDDEYKDESNSEEEMF